MPVDIVITDYVILIAHQDRLLIMLLTLVFHAIHHVKHVYNIQVNVYHVMLVHISLIICANQVAELVHLTIMESVNIVHSHVYHV